MFIVIVIYFWKQHVSRSACWRHITCALFELVSYSLRMYISVDNNYVGTYVALLFVLIWQGITILDTWTNTAAETRELRTFNPFEHHILCILILAKCCLLHCIVHLSYVMHSLISAQCKTFKQAENPQYHTVQ